MAEAFETTLAVIEQLQTVNVEGVTPTFQVTGLENVMRDDVVDENRMFSQDQALANAKATHDGYFVVQHDKGSGTAVVGGTSASSPAMAGIMALIVQKTGERQGTRTRLSTPSRPETRAIPRRLSTTSFPGATTCPGLRVFPAVPAMTA